MLYMSNINEEEAMNIHINDFNNWLDGSIKRREHQKLVEHFNNYDKVNYIQAFEYTNHTYEEPTSQLITFNDNLDYKNLNDNNIKILYNKKIIDNHEKELYDRQLVINSNNQQIYNNNKIIFANQLKEYNNTCNHFEHNITKHKLKNRKLYMDNQQKYIDNYIDYCNKYYKKKI